MFSSGLIVFREVLEIALIVSLVLAASRGIQRRWLYVGGGVAAGVVLSIFLAAGTQTISASIAGIGQELLNASILFAAVAMLAWHNIWMQRHGAELATRMRQVGQAVLAGNRPLYVLATVAGLATLREGAEIVLFMHGILAGGADKAALVSGGLIGLLVGLACGATLYLGLLRLSARHLFRVSSWLILLLAAGMAAKAAGFLVQANVLPELGAAVWDSSYVLSERSIIGQISHALFGYISQPSGIQVVFYVSTLLLIGLPMILIGRRPIRRAPALAMVVGVTAFGFAALFQPGAVYATHKVYSPTVEQGEFEFEVRSHTTRDSNPSLDRETKTKLEVGYGVTKWWYTSIFFEFEKAPGASDTDHEATAWENIFQLTEPGKYWLDTGLYLEYEKAKSSGSPDKFEAKLLLEKPVGNYLHTANLILEREVGTNRSNDTEFEFAWRSKYRFKPSFEPGVELYWAPGAISDFKRSTEQELSIGPVIGGKFSLGNKRKLRYEIGYLHGLNDATPRDTWKALLEYEFRF